MRIACWVTKVTETHCENIILIVVPRLLHERSSELLYRCTASLVTVGAIHVLYNRQRFTKPGNFKVAELNHFPHRPNKGRHRWKEMVLLVYETKSTTMSEAATR